MSLTLVCESLGRILCHVLVLVMNLSLRFIWPPNHGRQKFCLPNRGKCFARSCVTLGTHDSNSLTNSKALLMIWNVSNVPTGYLPGLECKYCWKQSYLIEKYDTWCSFLKLAWSVLQVSRVSCWLKAYERLCSLAGSFETIVSVGHGAIKLCFCLVVPLTLAWCSNSWDNTRVHLHGHVGRCLLWRSCN